MARVWHEFPKINNTDDLLEEIFEQIKLQNTFGNKLVEHIIWPDTIKLGFD